MQMGKAYVQQDYKRAIDFGQLVLKKSPQDAATLSLVAEIYQAIGEVDKSILIAQRLLKAEKDELDKFRYAFEALKLLSTGYLAKKKYDECLNYVERGLSYYQENCERIDNDVNELSNSGCPESRISKLYSERKRDNFAWVEWAQEYLRWHKETRNS